MIDGDPNVANVEMVAAALGDLCDELVLVGGCAASLLIDAPTAPPPRLNLPSGRTINLIAAPAFLATKLEAFHTRGNADLLTSHDFEDIINVLEGRSAIVEEINAAGAALRTYLAAQFADIHAMPAFDSTLPGLVAFDELHGQRVAAVSKRILAIAALI